VVWQSMAMVAAGGGGRAGGSLKIFGGSEKNKK
jgi:hypothetical protein